MGQAGKGFRGKDRLTGFTFRLPPGTPADIVKRLNAEIAKALAQPALIATLDAEGSVPMQGTEDQAASFIKSEQAKRGALIREAGIKAD